MSLNTVSSVLVELRQFLGFETQLELRAVAHCWQQYHSYYLFRAISNVECEFRLSIRFCGARLQQQIGELGSVSVLFTRPLIERLIVVPLSHPIALKLAYKHLCLVSSFFPEIETQIRALRSIIQVPLGFRGVN